MRLRTSEGLVRYPLRAVLAVAFGTVIVLAELVFGALFIMPLVPLIPVFIALVLGNAFWMASLFHWAASLGQREPVRSSGVQPSHQRRATGGSAAQTA
jgi:hypothetical protein